ncbi:MAG: RDD family protein [Kiritimatiellaceae bacterium]|nr:RDD family protein [Kiritimatiellaceae bacterium]
MEHSGFWKRVVAYLIDIIPITLLVIGIFYFYFGFDDAIRAYFANKDDLDAKLRFYRFKGLVRDMSFFCWLGYCLFMESSPLQGTLGKYFLGMRVVDSKGETLSFTKALVRTLMKVISYVVLGAGFLWIAFTKQKQGWHDKVAKTFVINTNSIIGRNDRGIHYPESNIRRRRI